MKTSHAKWIYWLPRVICIFYALFLSLFAFDVFNEHSGFWDQLGAFIIHLLPTWIVLFTLLIAWKREWIGSVIFPAIALFHLFSFLGRLHWSSFIVIEAPLFLIGILFLINWKQRESGMPV